jgi:hypothetical protein
MALIRLIILRPELLAVDVAKLALARAASARRFVDYKELSMSRNRRRATAARLIRDATKSGVPVTRTQRFTRVRCLHAPLNEARNRYAPQIAACVGEPVRIATQMARSHARRPGESARFIGPGSVTPISARDPAPHPVVGPTICRRNLFLSKWLRADSSTEVQPAAACQGAPSWVLRSKYHAEHPKSGPKMADWGLIFP